ncbi:MAG: hypothetical protein PHS60_02165 [Zavarzinia sp.]|nr:hypothetical protein [Zavarzinia sp.]
MGSQDTETNEVELAREKWRNAERMRTLTADLATVRNRLLAAVTRNEPGNKFNVAVRAPGTVFDITDPEIDEAVVPIVLKMWTGQAEDLEARLRELLGVGQDGEDES